jgi:hypothetical protein
MSNHTKPLHKDIRSVGEVVESLDASAAEISQAIYACILEAVPDPVADGDPAYRDGLLAAITEVLDYSLTGLRQDLGWSAPLPPAAAAQARQAARAGVGLGTVLRRYVAAHRRLGEFIMREAESVALSDPAQALHHLRRRQDELLEALTAAIEDEYNLESDWISVSPDRRRSETVRKLLSDDPVEPAEAAALNYELCGTWHMGLIATRTVTNDEFRRLARALGCQHLLVSAGETAWAWLGAPRKLAVEDVERALSLHMATDTSFAVGEPREGLRGWRQTHREAHAALSVAISRPHNVTRCADVTLEAAVLQVDNLASLLLETYLAPLKSARIGGETLRKTLRAYLAVGCNAATAAAKLGVDRHTVERHVHAAERSLGRPLRTCLPELAVALRLETLRRWDTIA